jgi:hypothetical protein
MRALAALLLVLLTGLPSARAQTADKIFTNGRIVTVDDIKDIKPLLTMVGGKAVYSAPPK